MVVQLRRGHVLEVLAGLPATSVHVCVTSPPYWGLRAYGTPPQVWGGDTDCAHEWGDPIIEHKRGPAGPHVGTGNNANPEARVATAQQGAFCIRCQAWRGELGSEPTLDRFVAHLVEVFAAVKRVMRDDATLWVNLGDSYNSVASNQNGAGLTDRRGAETVGRVRGGNAEMGRATVADPGLKPGDLCLAPARFALAMQAAGWTLRSEITLCKSAPMPESVQGARWERCRVKTKPMPTRPHPEMPGRDDTGGGWINEKHLTDLPTADWADCPGCPKCAAQEGYVQRWGSGRPTSATEKLLLFVKAGHRYFWDAEAVRVPGSPTSHGGTPLPMRGPKHEETHQGGPGALGLPAAGGRNLWNYVMWAPEPLKEGHYAAFPRWLPRLAIQAGTSERGVCPGCGSPWLRVMSVPKGGQTGASWHDHAADPERGNAKSMGAAAWKTYEGAQTLGWRSSCACPPHEPAPAVVLDPFAGSGTTLLEANALGRHGWGIELQAKYVAIAHQRLSRQPLSLFAHEGAAALGGEAAGD